MRCIFFTILIALLPTIGFSKSSSDIDKQIANVKQSLTDSQKKHDKLSGELKNSEKKISELSVTIGSFNKKITQQNTDLKTQENQLNDIQQKLDTQQTTLAKLISANYQLQRKGKLGLFFSGKTAEEINRNLNYYQTIDTALINAIEELQNSAQQRKELILDINKNTASLKKLLDEQTNQKKQISSQQSKRQSILQQLDKTISSNQEKLNQLTTDQKNLSNVVDKLAPSTTSTANFSDMKSKLNWPVSGKLLHSFGQNMQSNIIKWKGDLIAAPAETPVKSIYAGKVVYADWLSGYGLLIIVDHGHGYLSLYGRNHALYKKVGDGVQAGEQIASVGQSGGYTDNALYFEIRHNGQATNPKPWFKTSSP